MAHPGHEKIICTDCKAVIRQCRCPAEKPRIERGLCGACREQASLPLITQCCVRDTDGDGNCPIHSEPGVLRDREQLTLFEIPWKVE